MKDTGIFVVLLFLVMNKINTMTKLTIETLNKSKLNLIEKYSAFYNFFKSLSVNKLHNCKEELDGDINAIFYNLRLLIDSLDRFTESKSEIIETKYKSVDFITDFSVIGVVTVFRWYLNGYVFYSGFTFFVWLLNCFITLIGYYVLNFFWIRFTAYRQSCSSVKALASIKVASDHIISSIYLSDTDASNFSNNLYALLESADNFYSD